MQGRRRGLGLIALLLLMLTGGLAIAAFHLHKNKMRCGTSSVKSASRISAQPASPRLASASSLSKAMRCSKI